MILVTGFEPFGGEARNPSWDAVEALGDEVAGQRIEKLRLPVVYGECFVPVRAAMEKAGTECRAVLCVGQAGGRAAVTPEAIGINRLHHAPQENPGGTVTYAPIIEGGPAAYFSTFPSEAMVRRMLAAQVPAAPSFHAGTYVCNNLLYLLMHEIESKGLPVLGGFVHVPFSTEQACRKASPPASLPLQVITEGLRLCLEEMALALR